MDPITLGYYALVCAIVGAASPRFGRLPSRLIAGAVIGIGAATLLPLLRAFLNGMAQ